MSEMTVGGRCGYWGWEHGGDDSKQCDKLGLRITVLTPSGMPMSIVRCVEHSDWIEAKQEQP